MLQFLASSGTSQAPHCFRQAPLLHRDAAVTPHTKTQTVVWALQGVLRGLLSWTCGTQWGLCKARWMKAQLHAAEVGLSPSQRAWEDLAQLSQRTRRQRVTLPGHGISHSNALTDKPCSSLIINLTFRDHNSEHLFDFVRPSSELCEWK